MRVEWCLAASLHRYGPMLITYSGQSWSRFGAVGYEMTDPNEDIAEDIVPYGRDSDQDSDGDDEFDENELRTAGMVPLKKVPTAGDFEEAAILMRASESQTNLHGSLQEQMETEQLARHLPPVILPCGFGPCPADDGKVFFFDIDNCLYKRSTKIHDLMQIYIHRYFKYRLGMSDSEAERLHQKYYKEYGLAIEGLVRHRQIDALEYNKVVDDALPLDRILHPNPELRKFLIRMRQAGKISKLWLFTNAYRNHGIRVAHLLGVGDLFDGLTFCDYSQIPMICKPMRGAFDNALKAAGVTNPANAYFIDDSKLNTDAASSYGWGHVIQYVEKGIETTDEKPNPAVVTIDDLMDIERVCPELF